MLPSPLHPAIVHFPIVLMVFLPLVAFLAAWAIRRGANPIRAWAIPVALAGALTLSAWASVETGESQEDAMEEAVGEASVAAHEEAAERFLIISGVVLVIMAAGLLQNRMGRAARVTGIVAALALMGAGWQVGHTGGQLVYADGAPRGLAGAVGPGGQADRPGGEGREQGERGERGEGAQTADKDD